MKAKTKSSKLKTSRASGEKIEIGSGNVFADLGLPEAEQLLLKAELTSRIAQLIKMRLDAGSNCRTDGFGSTQGLAAFARAVVWFSADRLFAILNRLGHSVEVRISPKERPPEKSHTRVMIG